MSSTTVHKFDIQLDRKFTLEMPKGAKIIAMGQQGTQPRVWVAVDRDAPLETRKFVCVGTGYPIGLPLERVEHMGSIMTGSTPNVLVHHLFEIRDDVPNPPGTTPAPVKVGNHARRAKTLPERAEQLLDRAEARGKIDAAERSRLQALGDAVVVKLLEPRPRRKADAVKTYTSP